MCLSNDQRSRLVRELAAAFPSYERLDEMVGLELCTPLPSITPPKAIGLASLDVVRHFEAHGTIRNLVRAAARVRPERAALRTLAAELGVWPSQVAEPLPEVRTEAKPEVRTEVVAAPVSKPAGSKGPVRWLHLTDFHCGQQDQERRWDQVKHEFLRDLSHYAKRIDGIDVLFFTGDLAYSGEKAEYVRIQRNLEEIMALLATLGSRPALLAVPGNHDVVLPREPLPAAVRSLKQWHRDAGLRAAFWCKRPKSEEFRYVEKVLKNYQDWWKAHAAAEVWSNPHTLPGEFSTSLEINGARFGVAGLNSTFLQLWKGVQAGELDLDGEQPHRACGKPLREWRAEQDLAVLLTHQPPSWLAPARQTVYEDEIYPPGTFDLHLCGHLHAAVGTAANWLGSPGRRLLQGASLFGLESWEEAGQTVTQRTHGYSLGRFQRQDNGWLLEFWPRTAEPVGGGGWNFGPDRRFRTGPDQVVQELIADS